MSIPKYPNVDKSDMNCDKCGVPIKVGDWGYFSKYVNWCWRCGQFKTDVKIKRFEFFKLEGEK